MPPKGHSNIGGSGMYMWEICAGQPRMASQFPNRTSVYAAEGTVVHYCGELVLTKQKEPVELLGLHATVDEDGKVWLTKRPSKREGYKFVIDEEMIEAIDLYINTVWADMTPNCEMHVERSFDLGWLYPGLRGTNDCTIIRPYDRVICYDYKHGKGKAVEVDGPQLKYYAVGAVQGEDVETAELVIVQPRAYHPDGPVRRLTMTRAELMDWAQNVLKPAAQATEDPNAPLVPGDHCHFCRALAHCPAVHERATAMAQSDFSVVPLAESTLPDPTTLTSEQMSKILDGSKLVRAWMSAVEDAAYLRLSEGKEVPGYKLVAKRSTRKWVDEAEAARELQLQYGVDVFQAKLKSPAQMEKLVKANGQDPNRVLEGLWETPAGDPTLAPESDRRPAVNPNVTAQEIFAVEE